jgi:hypothetical protein
MVFNILFICRVQGTGTTVLDHPIDIHYDTSTTEGWPVIVFEVLYISLAQDNVIIFYTFSIMIINIRYLLDLGPFSGWA